MAPRLPALALFAHILRATSRLEKRTINQALIEPLRENGAVFLFILKIIITFFRVLKMRSRCAIIYYVKVYERACVLL